MQKNVLEEIISILDERLKSSIATFKDYEDLINAYIHIVKESRSKLNLEQAIKAAENWKLT